MKNVESSTSVSQSTRTHSTSGWSYGSTVSQEVSQRREQRVTPPVHVCKQSVDADVKDVVALETTLTKAVFGECNIANLIEKGICRSIFNTENELVAFIAVGNYPNVGVYRHSSWQGWLRRYYSFGKASPWNSIFIQYLVWDVKYPEFFMHFLTHFYKNVVHLEHIFLVLPPGIGIFNELASHFNHLYPQGDGVSKEGKCQTVFINQRVTVVSKLVVRRACEEDNIDVQPILHYQHDILQQIFGEFKLGSVIDLTDKNKAIIVAEHHSTMTVGVMCLTMDIDYQQVRDFYHVPLVEFALTEEMKPTYSKITLRGHEWICAHTNFASEEDLQSLKPEMFGDDKVLHSEQDEVTDHSVTEETIRTSQSTVYLDDEDSEFRIIDPAMHYLLAKAKESMTSSQLESTDSYSSDSTSMSLTCNTYYGRPSWAIKSCRSRTPSDQSFARERDAYRRLAGPYNGAKDGFQISLYAFHPDLDVRYAYDMLEASFECFPEKKYCLLSLPTFYQGSPLTKYFVRLSPRFSRDFPSELYLVHRNAIFSEFSVRPVSLADLEDISNLVRHIPQNRKIIKAVASLLMEEDTGHLGYVLECDECIVGVVVLTTNFILPQMQPHFRLEELLRLKHYGRDRHGLLIHCVVSVLFFKKSSFFLRQILLLADLDTLSYCHHPYEEMVKMDMTLPSVLEALCPSWPRERIVYNSEALDVHTPEEFVLGLEREFALFIATEKFLSIHTLELNYRVVIIGASDTALSFLENLIFRSAKKHIRYNNLTLVSVHGLPLEFNPHNAADKMTPHSGLYTREYLVRLSLQTHINILYGVATDINRKEKMICLNDEHWLRYDYLFFFTGTQFCKPTLAKPRGRESMALPEVQRESTEQEPHNQDILESGENLLLVNTSGDATVALGYLKKIIVSHKRSDREGDTAVSEAGRSHPVSWLQSCQLENEAQVHH